MLGEVWRRLRDDWWSPDMAFGGDAHAGSAPANGSTSTNSLSSLAPAGVADWPGVLTRYASVLPRVAARSELADLFYEMAAELRWGGASWNR